MRELRDKVAVVTDGASGIGRALPAEGARVVVADIDRARAETVAAELRGHGAAVEALACDVTCGAAVERLAVTVRIAVDGIKVDDFFVITHPHVRKYAQARHDQVMAACDRADLRPRPPGPRHRGN